MSAARPSEVLVGVDIGTTRIKAVIVGLDGRELAVAAVPTPWRSNGTAVETDAVEIADRALGAIASAVAQYRPERVIAVGVTGMGESGVLVDEHDEPVAPVVAWHDPRACADEVAEALPDFSVSTGLPMAPTATIMKIPDLLRMADGRARHWLNLPEWVVRKLGGRRFTEISLAARTGLYHIHDRALWPDAFEFIAASPDLIPTEPQLGVVGAGPATFSPVVGAELVVAGHDHQVAAYGEGVMTPTSMFDSLGTAEALVRIISPPPPPGQHIKEITDRGFTIGPTVVADRMAILAGLPTGQVLERIGGLLGCNNRADRHDLSTKAATVEPHLALKVETSPTGLVISGVRGDVEPAHLWRAAVEAADAQAAQVIKLFDRLHGPVDDVVIGGGWINDPTVRSIKQRRFPNFRTSSATESGAVGAALMAGARADVVAKPQPGNKPTPGGY